MVRIYSNLLKIKQIADKCDEIQCYNEYYTLDGIYKVDSNGNIFKVLIQEEESKNVKDLFVDLTKYKEIEKKYIPYPHISNNVLIKKYKRGEYEICLKEIDGVIKDIFIESDKYKITAKNAGEICMIIKKIIYC